MSLFERLSRIARAEANYAKSQSITPEEEMERAISQMRSDVIAIQIAIGRVPASQAKFLKKRLTLLESQLSEAESKRDALLTRIKRANNKLQKATGVVNSPFQRMEEKVLELEAQSQAAHEFVSKDDLEKQFALIQSKGEADEELEVLRKQLRNL